MGGLDPVTWAIILTLVGCALIVLEVFIPSGGVLTLFCVVSLVAGIVMAFRRDTTTGLVFILITLVAVPAVVALAFKYWPMTPMGKAFLGELPSGDEAFPVDPRRALIGKVGVAKSKMLPSGAVMVEGKLLDAVSQGEAIDPGQPIVVVEVRANRVMVRLADEQETRQARPESEAVFDKPIEEFGLESIDDPLA